MTKLNRCDGLGLFAVGMLLLSSAALAQQRPALADQMARIYGLDGFKQIEAIRYTFNAELPGTKLSRSWEWSPKTDTVSYQGKDKQGQPVTATYRRAQLDSQSDAVKTQIDPAFVNDSYWLLLPLHAVWDGSATVTGDGVQKLPVGEGTAERIVMKYPAQGGYAPGDTWEFYVGADKRVAAIVYRRGGPKKPSVVIATWEGQKQAGPLLISTDHRATADGKPVHIFLTDVAVKLTGSPDWVSAR